MSTVGGLAIAPEPSLKETCGNIREAGRFRRFNVL